MHEARAAEAGSYTRRKEGAQSIAGGPHGTGVDQFVAQLEYFGRSDHTFSLKADREELFGIISRWVADFATQEPVPTHAPQSARAIQ